jgi:RND family efflux transporter MFP subunit
VLRHLALLLFTLLLLAACGNQAPSDKAVSKPALTISTVMPQQSDWPQTITANGNVIAWQEAIIGAEVIGYRITEVLANIGDKVKKGQVLARISTDSVSTELTEAKSAVAELEAMLAEAKANSERARQLRDRGFFSPQQITQSLTAEQSAQARLNAARARLQAISLRFSKTQVMSPDDGVISARSATVGSLTQPGMELFRLIRGSRLEWRAEVTATELSRIAPGVAATLTTPNGERVIGKVRSLAPTIDPQSRNAIVYVDLPESNAVRAGMFARGEFELARSPALTLPQSAVVIREGFAYVFRVEGEGEQGKVKQLKVALGRRQDNRLEITSGIDAKMRFAATGGGFLADGDSVRIVNEAEVAKATAQ